MSERLYFADAFLTAFQAQVTDIREVSRSRGQSLWQIALDRSAFYPTGGGQPHDTGKLTAASPGGATLEAPILAVDEDAEGEVWHTTPKPLPAGTVVRGLVDWRRRRDHMQQHSGQHLLSAIFRRAVGAATVSFHLGESVSTIDLALADPEGCRLDRIEDEVNEIVAEDRPVAARTIPRAEAEALLAAGVLAKLPEREGAIRLIEIEGVESNACGGTHVRSTGQIGCLLLRGRERVRRLLRVEFVCGLRAAAVAGGDSAALSRAAARLSVGRLQVPEAADRLLAEVKALKKERQRLREESANALAARLVVEAPIENGLRLVRRVFADRDADYVHLLASRLAACAPRTCALLASTAEEPASVVAARSRDLEMDAAVVLRDALASHASGDGGSRSGGSPEMARGQIPAMHLDALLARLEARLRTT